MKIKPEDYDYIKSRMKKEYQALQRDNSAMLQEFLSAGHSDKREAWTIFIQAGLNLFLCDHLYKYLNDTHMDTALLKIWKDLKSASNKD